MNLLFYIFEFFVLTLAAVSPPFVSLNTSEVANAISNRPNSGTPDRRFRININFDGPKFPLISCLMNTVEILVIIGSQDFSGSMEKASWKLANYPEVGIVITPSTEDGRIERRIVIWGLSQGVAHMIHFLRFQAVTFTLSWEGKEVGTIKLVAWPSTQYTVPDKSINSTQDLVQESRSSLVRPSSNPSVVPENTNLTADPKWTVRILLTESMVPLFGVFLAVIAVLVDAAEMGPARQIRRYVSPAIAAGVLIVFEEPVPARTRPPFFEAKWLMVTVAAIPEFMIKKGVFEEAFVMVEVDGVGVADGFLIKQDSRASLNANVSVS